MDLELMALHWLRWEKRCLYALCERAPRSWGGRPDVIGVNPAGFVLEIEVKRSMADFRADARKPHVEQRTRLHAEGSYLDDEPKEHPHSCNSGYCE